MPQTLERRAAPRFSIQADCRFLLRGEIEGKGSLLDISSGGLALITDCIANEGDEIVIYPEGVGRLTGRVARTFSGGVGVEFLLSASQKKTISERIASLVAGVPYFRLSENRSSIRITYNLETNARLDKSKEYFPCTIIDMSRTGCLLQSDVRPELGERLVIGTLKGIVRRHSDDGFAIEFLKNSRLRDKRRIEDETAA